MLSYGSYSHYIVSRCYLMHLSFFSLAQSKWCKTAPVISLPNCKPLSSVDATKAALKFHSNKYVNILPARNVRMREDSQQ